MRIRDWLWSFRSEKAKAREMEKAFESVDEESVVAPNKEWHERLHGRMATTIICSVIASLFAGYLLYRLGWK